MTQGEGNRAKGRWLGSSRASRADLQRQGILTTGFVAVGIRVDLRTIRAIVEYPSIIDISGDHARLWRGDPDTARQNAEIAARQATRDPAVGQGLAYQVYHLDSPDCPIALDWRAWAIVMKKSRMTTRDDFFRRRNMGFMQRLTWAELESR